MWRRSVSLEDVAGPAEQTATTSGDAPSRARVTHVRTIAVTTAVTAAVLKVMSGVLQALGVAHFSLSARGSLVYVPGEVQPNRFNLVRVNRSGTIERTFGAQRFYNQPRAAPDGLRFVVDVADEESRLWELWLYDLRANELNQLTYRTDGDNRHASWAGPNQLVIQSDRKGTRQLFLHQVDGGAVEQLTDFPDLIARTRAPTTTCFQTVRS